MRLIEMVIDDECATYVGQVSEWQGYDGRITHETAYGKWITLKDTFLQGERVNTTWAYEMNETILTAFFGRPYYAPFVSVFVPNTAIRDRRTLNRKGN